VARLPRAQEGIDDLNSRLNAADRLPSLPLPPLVLPPRVTERAVEGDAPLPLPPARSSLVEIATEVALLNALSEVLVRHHEAAQDRAAAAAARLQRAEAHAAALAAGQAALPARGSADLALALEYVPTESSSSSSSSRAALVAATPRHVPLTHDAVVRACGRQAAECPLPSSPPSASLVRGIGVLTCARAACVPSPSRAPPKAPVVDALRNYRDARAEARSAAARDAAVVARSRELLALTASRAEEGRGGDPLTVHMPVLQPRSPSPLDHTPAAGGMLVVHNPEGTVLPRGAPVGDGLRSLLDYVFSDADFASVLTLLSAVGGNAGPPPASVEAIRAVPELRLCGAGAALDAACCPVCLTDLACGDVAVKAMPCGSVRVPHAFHAHCIERWLRMHNSCPTCRAALTEPQPEEEEAVQAAEAVAESPPSSV
jgi:hypothetical protein